MAPDERPPEFLNMLDIDIEVGRFTVFFLCTCGGEVIAEYNLLAKRYTLWHRRPEDEQASEHLPMKFMNLDSAFRQNESGISWFVSQVHAGKLPKALKRHRT